MKLTKRFEIHDNTVYLSFHKEYAKALIRKYSHDWW